MSVGMRFLTLFVFFSYNDWGQINLESGTYKGQLAMNDRLTIPFHLFMEKENNKWKAEIVNGKEHIPMHLTVFGDSITTRFPEMDAYLRFCTDGSQTSFRGYWVNQNKKKVVKIPFTASIEYDEVGLKKSTADLSGRWRTTFDPTSSAPEAAIGVFTQNHDWIEGTFLTETGDYRYLYGNMKENAFSLSTFNGSWAFLFDGKVVGDSIYGDFYSGPSYHTEWIAVKDAAAQLRDEKSLTYVVNDKAMQTAGWLTLTNKPFANISAKYKNKVVIYQIMGTWCPNCIDEIKLYKEFYKTYHAQGLEIVALAYEVGTDKKVQLARLKAFKKKMNLPYEIVLAGTSSKDVAAEQFPMLNGIMSFPTSVFVDKKGKVQTVFTGFSGPATGADYQKLSEEIRNEILRLMK